VTNGGVLKGRGGQDRKCTQRTICLLYGKRRLIGGLLSQEPEGAPTAPLESATEVK